MKLVTSLVILALAVIVTGCDVIRAWLAKPTAPLPDLAIVNVSYGTEPPGCTTPASQLTLKVAITNKGLADAGPFTVEVDGKAQNVVQGLAAGQYAYLTFPHADQTFHTVTIDKENAIRESDKTNNRMADVQVPLPTLPPNCTPLPSRP